MLKSLFEASVDKLNIPEEMKTAIKEINNVCLEAEGDGKNYTPNPKDDKHGFTPVPKEYIKKNKKQNAPQAQPQQNANQQAGAPQGQAQGQQPQQGNNQQQPQQQKQQAPNQQNNQQIPENIDKNQVDSNKLMKQFNSFLEGCKKKVESRLMTEFGENAKKIIETVKRYVDSDSEINFDEEIVPLLTKNGQAPSKQVVNDVRNRLHKYFGLKIRDSQPKQQPQSEATPEQPPKQEGNQEAPQK